MTSVPDGSVPYVEVGSAAGKKFIPTQKAYKDDNFMSSHAARSIRIMCEFEEPAKRLAENGVLGTILFFGSARSMSPEDYKVTSEQLKQQINGEKDEEKLEGLVTKLEKLKKTEWMCSSYGQVRDLAARIAKWSENNEQLRTQMKNCPPLYMRQIESESSPTPLIVTTGGGPGFMEAANRGAVEGSTSKLSMGMAISLPFEKGVNQFVTPSLAFEFHYFFTRKFWMMYSAKALIVAPGGFGTCDELFEILTLKQTGKMAKDLPVVLLGKKYWLGIINWDVMVEYGTVSQEDVDSLLFTDDVDEAFEHVTNVLLHKKTGIQSQMSPSGSKKFFPDAMSRIESGTFVDN